MASSGGDVLEPRNVNSKCSNKLDGELTPGLIFGGLESSRTALVLISLFPRSPASAYSGGFWQGHSSKVTALPTTTRRQVMMRQSSGMMAQQWASGNGWLRWTGPGWQSSVATHRNGWARTVQCSSARIQTLVVHRGFTTISCCTPSFVQRCGELLQQRQQSGKTTPLSKTVRQRSGNGEARQCSSRRGSGCHCSTTLARQ